MENGFDNNKRINGYYKIMNVVAQIIIKPLHLLSHLLHKNIIVLPLFPYLPLSVLYWKTHFDL